MWEKIFQVIVLWRAKLNNISILPAFSSINAVHASRTIAVANSRCPKKTSSDALKVSEIHVLFSCIYGRKIFKTECTGKLNPRIFFYQIVNSSIS